MDAIPARLTGKDEMNLADFAIGIIRMSGDKEEQQRSVSRTQTVKTAQGLLQQEWIVTASGQYGFPQPSDDDILLGLIHLAAEDRFRTQTVPFSRYGLCKLMGWPTKGQNYERIEGALHRLTGVKINAKHSFYDGIRKQYVSKVFGVIDSFQISDGRDVEHPSYARFSDDLWASIQCNNIKPIDLATYYSLRSPIARRLYRFLDKRKLNRSSFELELESLSQVNIGLSNSTRVYPSQIKQSLNGPHKELEKIGFLSGVNYFLGSNKAWRVRYLFSQDALAPPKRANGLKPDTKEELWLTKRGVSNKVAAVLAIEHRERIPDLLDFYDFVLQKHPGHWTNPVGWLVQAIRDGYAIPQDFADYVPREKRKILEADKQEFAAKILQREALSAREERARNQRWATLRPAELQELALFVRSQSAWASKLAPDHPGLRAAMLDALESGLWTSSEN